MDDAVRQRGFAVVDVGDDGKITDMLHEAQNINVPSKAAVARGADSSRF
jgi:hypothetical protein